MKLPSDCLYFFAKMIEREIGIIYAESNYYQLESRLEEISRQAGLSDVSILWEQARIGQLPGTTKMLLLDIATNNETLFFRDQSVFNAIGKIFEDATTSRDRPFRVWSAACSTGQEVYSISMLRSKAAEQKSFFATILGTDVSSRVLARAEDGVYTQLEVQRGLSASELVRFFEPLAASAQDAPQWKTRSVLKDDVKFSQLNLLQPRYSLDQFDLILCRNVLIYQTVESKSAIVAKLVEHLAPGGVLILGGSESLVGINDVLKWSEMCGASIYRKPDFALERAS